MVSRLAVGDFAPGFTLRRAHGGAVSLADFHGYGVIVYFFPRAMTPGCTTQACGFRDHVAYLAASDYVVVGISPDPVARLEQFAEEYGLRFPLASDQDLATATAWGAVKTKVKDGEPVTGVLRSTIVVSRDGTVELAEYGVVPDGHVTALVAALGGRHQS